MIAKTCPCCGTVTTADWADTVQAVPQDPNGAVVSGPGSPVRVGPRALAMCALLTCAHYLPVARATALLQTMTGLHVATGFTAGVRSRAARILTDTFVPHMKTLLARAPVLHADETTGRANQALAFVHVACTEYLTLMHVGDRSATDIDNGGVLPGYTGTLVRDGYASYAHLRTPTHTYAHLRTPTHTYPPSTPGAVPTSYATYGPSPTPTPPVNSGHWPWPRP